VVPPGFAESLRLLVEVGGETDAAALGRRRVREFSDGGEDGGDGLVVVLVLALKLIELAGESGVGGQKFAQAHESTHDVEALVATP
jgi:hypothetical protein